MPAQPHPLNAPGPIFVTDDCIFCGQCVSDVPEVFAEAPEALAFVARQPDTSALHAAVSHAIERCPTESIVRAAS